MKNFIKKHIALILSLALIVGTVLPLVSGNITSATGTTDAEKIAALKAAWTKMEKPIGTVYHPVAYRYEANTNQAGLLATGTNVTSDTYSTLADTDDDFLNFGTAKATYDILDGANKTKANTNSKYSVFFDSDEGLNKGKFKFTANIDGLFVAFRTESVTASGELGFNFIQNGTTYSSTYTVAIDSSKASELIKVPLSEVWDAVSTKPGTFTEYFTENILTRLDIVPIKGLDAKVTFGSVISFANAKLPSESVTAKWGIADWVYAASIFDTTGYFNSSEFTTIVNELKVEYAKDLSIAALKSAWTEMGKPTNLLYPSYEKVNGVSATPIPGDSIHETAVGTLPYGATADSLGKYYSYYHTSYDGDYSYPNTNISSSNRMIFYGSPSSNAYANIPLADIGEFYFNIYIEDVKANGVIVPAIVNSNSNSITGISIPIDSTMEGKWITLKDTDLFIGGVKGMIDGFNAKSYNPDLSSIMLNLCSGLVLKACVGSVVEVKKLSLPAGSENWSVSDLMTAADNLDTTGLTNVENFKAKLADLIAEYGAEYQIAKLKTAWTSMYNIGDTVYNPVLYRKADKNDQIKGTLTSSNQDEISYLGDAYNTFDVADGKNRKLPDSGSSYTAFWAADPDSLSAGVYKCALESDMFVNFRVNSLNSEGKFGFKFITGGYSFLSNVTVNITSDSVGKWNKVSLSDIYSDGSWNNGGFPDDKDLSFTDFFKKHVFTRMEIVPLNGLDANTTLGSILTFNSAILPTGTDSWTPADWVSAAESFDTTGYLNTEEFKALTAEMREACGDDIIIADLKNAWGSMYTESTALYPSAEKVNNITAVLNPSLIKKTSAGNLPYNADPAILGSVYAHHTASYDGSYSYANTSASSTERVLYYNSTTATKVNDLPYSGITGFNFSFYIEDVKHAGTMVPSFVNNKYNTVVGKAINIDETMEGKWITLKDTDLISGGVKALDSSFTSNGLSATLGSIMLSVANGLIIKGYYGSVIVNVPVQLPSDTDSWTLADWAYVASNLDISRFKNTEPFTAALARTIEVRDENSIERACTTTSYAAAGDVDVSAFGDNLLTGLTPVIKYYDGSTTSNLNVVNDTLLTDGAYNNDFAVGNAPYSNGNSFTEFIYKFNGIASIDRALISNAILQNLRNTKYKIYLSNNQTDLFDSSSLLVSYDNSTLDQTQVFDFTDNLSISGTYFGIIVYSPASNMSDYDGNVRFTELALYGNVELATVKTGNFTNEDIAAIGTNLLSSKDIMPMVRLNTGVRQTWSKTFSNYKNIVLRDGDVTTPASYYGDSVLTSADDEIDFCIYFDLKGTYNINKILYNSWYQKYLETGRYEIYASRDVNSLFTTRNRIISYDNMPDGPNGTSISQLFNMNGDGVVARFIAFRIKYPVSDYARTVKSYGANNANIRLTELGVYGTPYVKPFALVNLLSHVPMNLYRTDSQGVRNTVPESEYSGAQHKLTYDGKLDAPATVNRNGKKLDFVYNLSADMKLSAVDLKTLTKNIKNAKFYASSIEEAIWNEDSLVYSYSGDATGSVRKDFPDTSLLKARYLRISITDTVNDAVDVTEISAIGSNSQEFNYLSLLEENSGATQIYLENRSDNYNLTTTTPLANKYGGSWGGVVYPYERAFDNDLSTVTDLYGGDNDTTSINILIDLNTTKAIDTIRFLAGSSEDYWPEKVKFYMGMSDVELFGKDAKPVKTYTSRAADGDYQYDLVPQQAQYLRIEFEKAKHKYYDNKVLAIINEIQVKGLEIVGRTGLDGVVQTFTDPATGIKLDIMGLSENDAFSKVQSIMVVKRDTEDSEKDYVKEQGVRFLTPAYDIYMLDVNGNIVDDLGGRTLRVSIPQSLVSKTDDVYVLAGDFGSFDLIETETVDGYYVFNAKDPSNLSYALGEFYDYPIDETTDDNDDDYYDELSNDYSFDDFDDTDDTLIDDDVNSARRVKKMMVKKNNGTDDYLTWILIIAGSVILVAAAGFCFYFFVFKKKKKEDEEPDVTQ